MLHGFSCLPRARAAAPVAQACCPATEPNSYRSNRYHNSMIDSLSPHLIGGLLELCIEAGERAHDGPESRCAHRTLTQIHGSSVRGPCRHVRRKNAAARRSVLPTSPRLRL